MLRLLLRRAVVQIPLLAAVLTLVVVGATLLGVCVLLLTSSEDRALEVGVARTPPDQVAVTAYATGILGRDARSVADDTEAVLTSALAPFPATSARRVSSAMRELGTQLPDARRLAYLSSVDELPDRARLTAGRWPGPTPGTGPLEAVVLEPTARSLGLHVGSRVELGREVRPAAAAPLAVTVVGVFRPLPDAGWERDPLAARGHDPAFADGKALQPADAYGPFVIDPAALLSGLSTIDRLEVTARPDVSAPTLGALQVVTRSVGAADRRLAAALGPRVQVASVVSGWGTVLADAHARQRSTRSTVFVVAVLCGALAAAALGLVGLLVVSVRAEETALLSALGLSRAQQVRLSAGEALALAAVATVIAVPASVIAHAALTRLSPLAGAGLTTPPVATAAQVVSIVVAALLLAAVLVVPALRAGPAAATTTRGRTGLLVRTGADVALLAVAGVAWWQLHTQPAGPPADGTDVVRVWAPTLCLVAGAALAVRLVAAPLWGADRLARRSRSLVLPLAAFEAARRPRATAAAFLLVLAAAAGAFGLAFGATWQRSQYDQSDLRVGTDFALALDAPAAAGQGEAVARATGGVLTPVADQRVTVGQWTGTAEDGPPRLIALDSARAAALLRGSPGEHRTWSAVGAELAPTPGGSTVVLPAGAVPTLTGTADEAGLQVVPRLVLEGGQGLRLPCTAEALPLDGQPHALPSCATAAARRIVAVTLLLDDTDVDYPDQTASTSRVTVSLAVPGGTAAGTAWTATPGGGRPALVSGAAAAVTATPSGPVVRITAAVEPSGNQDAAFQPLPQLVATAYRPAPALPVAVSQRLSEVLGARAGTHLTLLVGIIPVPVVVADVVPAIPSAPGAVAMLADIDALSRAFVAAGDDSPLVTAWWVAGPAPGAAARAAGLGVGAVVTRDEVTAGLLRGPQGIGLPAALGVLVTAVVLLAVAGTFLHVTSDVGGRAVEIARLRGLGLRRRAVFGAVFAQHAGLLAVLLCAGFAVAALASGLIGAELVRSDVGAATVPTAVFRWPWAAEGALLAALLVGCGAAVAIVVAVGVRRADATHLRVAT